jgi:hypothetical protein
MAFTNALMPGFIKMITLRAPLVVRKRGIQMKQTYMDAALVEHRRLVQMMKEHNLSANPDKAALARLNAECSRELEVFQGHAKEQEELWRLQNDEMRNIMREMADMIAAITAAIPDALLAARSELDLPIDEAEYRRIFDVQRPSSTKCDAYFQFTPTAGRWAPNEA